MAYFRYSPENVEQSTPACLELVSRDETDRLAAMDRLLETTPDILYRWGMDFEKLDKIEADLQTVAWEEKSPVQALPIKSVGPLLEELGTEDIIDKETGLSMMVIEDEFMVSTQEIGPDYIQRVSDDMEVQRLVVQAGFNCLAYQMEVVEIEDQDLRENFSLGFGDADKDYQPTLTVLGPQNPLRQTIEVARALAADDATAEDAVGVVEDGRLAGS